MPIYEYFCERCSKTYEIIHKVNDHTTIVCDNCHKKIVKIVSPTGFRFLGEGFYKGKPQIDWD